VLALVIAVGWYYSNFLRNGALKPDYSPDKLNLVVMKVDGNRITLAERPDEKVESLTDEESWGLETVNGYGQVAAVLQADGDEVTREFTLLSGSMASGDFARLDSFAYQGDPFTARGLQFHSVSIPSALGDFPAWKVDGRQDTWVVFVHGWRSDRGEALRILPTISSLGLPSLVLTYRNDDGAPASSDGLIRWGETEWQDLEAAVDYANGQGAGSVILYGYSMGGGIIIRFLQESDRSAIVTAAILDAPVLDFNEVVDEQAGDRHIPGFVVAIGKQFASWRFDFDWSAVNHLEHADRLQVPILLFHGTDDDLAPIDVSRRFAAARSDIVTLVEVEGAGHVRSWNAGRQGYEAAVTKFLLSIVGAK
jgi:pimeloyl-ACP methyl ester carboxylesterase